MTDITTALETVRGVADWYDERGPTTVHALAALSTIEAELATLRMERDEAVAALRELAEYVPGKGKPVRAIARAVLDRLSTPKEGTG